MDFPIWVHDTAATEREIARNRLNYMINLTALRTVKGGSISAFAMRVSVDRSQLHRCIKEGAFPRLTAKRIEAAVGRDLLPYEWLVEPLKVVTAA